MVTSLPSRIFNYRVSSSSPTDELLTIGQILSEVGEYTSTILDREHLSMSRKCKTRLKRVVGELITRKCIQSANNLYEIPEPAPVSTDLRVLTIGELYNLYRCWPIRHEDRKAEGREFYSFYYEGRIVRELKNRRPADKSEQFKIDYCDITYRNELDNMSFVFSRPINVDNDKIFPDFGRCYTFDELTALIRLYADYRDISEREILVEYVDYALDLIECEKVFVSGLGLLAEVVELGRRKKISVPEWVSRKLEDTVKLALATKTGKAAEMSLAILTMQLLTGENTLTRRAQRIINQCYKSALENSAEFGERLGNLHTAVTFCDYVTHFSVRKVASIWDELSYQSFSSNNNITAKQVFQLLEIAKECEDYTEISSESKDKLKQMLGKMAQSECPEAMAYKKIVNLRM